MQAEYCNNGLFYVAQYAKPVWCSVPAEPEAWTRNMCVLKKQF